MAKHMEAYDSNGLAGVYDNGQWHLINKDANKVTDALWELEDYRKKKEERKRDERENL